MIKSKGIALVSVFSVWILGLLFILDSPDNTHYGRKLLDYNGNAKWLHNLPRNTINGDSVQPTLWLTNSTDYYSSLAAIAVVAFAFGCLSGIIGIIYCCVRFACKNKEDDDVSDDERPSKKQTIISLLITSLILVVMVILGLIGNGYFQPAMTDLFNKAAQEAQTQRARLESAEPVFDEINLNLTLLRGYVPVFNDDGKVTTDNVGKGQTSVGNNNQYRLIGLGFTYAFVGLIVVLTIVAMIFKLGKVSLAAGLLGFFAMFLTWISFGLHFSFSVVSADLCFDTASYTITRRISDYVAANGTNYGGLNDLLHCPRWRDADLSYQYTFELQVDLEQQQNATSDPNTIAALQVKIDNLAALQPVIKDARDCVWIESVFAPFADNVCNSYLTGLVMVWATNFIISVVLIPHTVFSIRGFLAYSGENKDGFF